MVWIVALAAAIQISHEKVNALNVQNLSSPGTLVLPRAETIKMLSGGYEQLFADWWWLNFVQYYGNTPERIKDHFAFAYSYLDLITRLDPRFIEPYWFTAFAVGSEQKRPDLAAQVIDRGIAANPDNWRVPFIAGVNQYLFAHDDRRAAEYYKLAAAVPDAPAWLNRQAQILASNTPALIKRTLTWDNIYRSSTETRVKEAARKQLVEIWTRVYKLSPSMQARKRALAELERLGMPVSESE